MGYVTIRYFAAAKAAAGVGSDTVELSAPAPLADVLAAALGRRPAKLTEVASVCSILVGDVPLGERDPATVTIRPGDEIQVLPPFAGG